jgi:hypothetical protein
MVVLNNAGESRDLSLDRFAERLRGYAKGRDVISGTAVSLEETLTVPAKTPMVLELRRGSAGAKR